MKNTINFKSFRGITKVTKGYTPNLYFQHFQLNKSLKKVKHINKRYSRN